MQRGDIWWASLPDPTGSSPGHRRPVLVVQADPFNRSRIQTAVVVVLTSNVDLADAPGNVLIRKRESRLKRNSVANVSQIITVDRSFLTGRISSLSSTTQAKVDDGLRLVLGLTP